MIGIYWYTGESGDVMKYGDGSTPTMGHVPEGMDVDIHRVWTEGYQGFDLYPYFPYKNGAIIWEVYHGLSHLSSIFE